MADLARHPAAESAVSAYGLMHGMRSSERTKKRTGGTQDDLATDVRLGRKSTTRYRMSAARIRVIQSDPAGGWGPRYAAAAAPLGGAVSAKDWISRTISPWWDIVLQRQRRCCRG